MANPSSRKFEARMTDVVFTGMKEGSKSAIYVRIPSYSELGKKAAEGYFKNHAVVLSRMGFRKLWEFGNDGYSHGVYVLDGFSGWGDGRTLIEKGFVEGMSYLMGPEAAKRYAERLAECPAETVGGRCDWLVRAFLPFTAPFIYTGSKNLFSGKEVYSNVMEQAFQEKPQFGTFSDSNVIGASAFFPDVYRDRAAASFETRHDGSKSMAVWIPWIYKRWGWNIEDRLMNMIREEGFEAERVKSYPTTINRKNSSIGYPDPYGQRSLYTLLYRVTGDMDADKASALFHVMSKMFPADGDKALSEVVRSGGFPDMEWFNGAVAKVRGPFLSPDTNAAVALPVENKVQPVMKGIYIQCFPEHGGKAAEILEKAVSEIPGVELNGWRCGRYCGGYVRHADNAKACGLENRIRLAKSILARLQTEWGEEKSPFEYRDPEMVVEVSTQFEGGSPSAVKIKIPNSLDRDLRREVRQSEEAFGILSAQTRAALVMEAFFASRMEPAGEWVPAQAEKQIYSRSFKFPVSTNADAKRGLEDLKQCIENVKAETAVDVSIVEVDYKERAGAEFDKNVVLPNLSYFERNFRNVAVHTSDMSQAGPEDIPEPEILPDAEDLMGDIEHDLGGMEL